MTRALCFFVLVFHLPCALMLAIGMATKGSSKTAWLNSAAAWGIASCWLGIVLTYYAAQAYGAAVGLAFLGTGAVLAAAARAAAGGTFSRVFGALFSGLAAFLPAVLVTGNFHPLFSQMRLQEVIGESFPGSSCRGLNTAALERIAPKIEAVLAESDTFAREGAIECLRRSERLPELYAPIARSAAANGAISAENADEMLTKIGASP